MSVFDSFIDESVSSWVLVYFVDSDPGKEFEILARTRLSVPESIPLRPRLKVKVFYGKAKIEAYVVTESDDYHYLHNNFKLLTVEYTERMLLNSIFVCDKDYKRKWDFDTQEPETKQTVHIMRKDEHTALQEQYDALKSKFDDLYRIQNVMRSTIDVLMERVEVLTEKADKKVDKTDNTENSDKSKSDKPEEVTESEEPQRSARKRRSQQIEEPDIEENHGMVVIGENKTEIPKEVFNTINWKSCSAATRKLLVAVFSKDVLATHSLTGKPSPAFLNANKEPKQQLDPRKTADIIDIVTRRCGVSASSVRNAITTKCADENKMCKKRKLKIVQVW